MNKSGTAEPAPPRRSAALGRAVFEDAKRPAIASGCLQTLWSSASTTPLRCRATSWAMQAANSSPKSRNCAGTSSRSAHNLAHQASLLRLQRQDLRLRLLLLLRPQRLVLRRQRQDLRLLRLQRQDLRLRPLRPQRQNFQQPTRSARRCQSAGEWAHKMPQPHMFLCLQVYIGRWNLRLQRLGAR